MKGMLMNVILLLVAGAATWAQGSEYPRIDRVAERLEAQKVAFITSKLELTPDESAKFWPIYNEFKDAEKAKRQELNPGKRLSDLSESEATALLDRHIAVERELVDLRETYIDRLKTVLPARKLVQLQMIEREFNIEVLQKIRERGRYGGETPRQLPERNP